jgi:hypothetical protein
MNPNPILEEAWRIKDQIAREADYDIEKLCSQTRAWAAANLHSSPLTQGAEELEASQPTFRENSNPPG